jgi:hypothetical protein
MALPKIYVYNACEVTANPLPDDTYFYSHPENPSAEQWASDCEEAIKDPAYGDVHQALEAKGYVLMENEICWYEVEY